MKFYSNLVIMILAGFLATACKKNEQQNSDTLSGVLGKMNSSSYSNREGTSLSVQTNTATLSVSTRVTGGRSGTSIPDDLTFTCAAETFRCYTTYDSWNYRYELTVLDENSMNISLLLKTGDTERVKFTESWSRED